MTTADRQRRYRLRAALRASAVMQGIEEIELAFFGVDANGEHVAITYDGPRGKRIPLTVRQVDAVPVVTQELAEPPQTLKRLYVPKGVPSETWPKIRAGIIDKGRAESVKTWKALAEAEPQNAKTYRGLIALVEAIPDGPDWAEHLPVEVTP